MYRTVGLLVLSVVLSACSVQPKHEWFHSSGSASQSQLQIDDSICSSAAYQAVGAPPSSTSGSTTTFSGSTSRGTTFEGQARTSPNSQMFGAAAGIQAAEADARYNNALRAIHRGCMAERGWTLRSR